MRGFALLRVDAPTTTASVSSMSGTIAANAADFAISIRGRRMAASCVSASAATGRTIRKRNASTDGLARCSPIPPV